MTEDTNKLNKKDLARAHEVFERQNLPRSERRVRITDLEGVTHSLKLHEADNYLERRKER